MYNHLTIIAEWIHEGTSQITQYPRDILRNRNRDEKIGKKFKTFDCWRGKQMQVLRENRSIKRRINKLTNV